MKTTLLIMAAGLGSRYDGNKQIDHIGPHIKTGGIQKLAAFPHAFATKERKGKEQRAADQRYAQCHIGNRLYAILAVHDDSLRQLLPPPSFRQLMQESRPKTYWRRRVHSSTMRVSSSSLGSSLSPLRACPMARTYSPASIMALAIMPKIAFSSL